jgi:hypothetical protein
MFNLLVTYYKKPFENIILKNNPGIGFIIILFKYLHEIFIFLSTAVPMKIILIMAMHRVPGIMQGELINNIDTDDLIIYLIIVTFIATVLCSLFKGGSALLKRKILKCKIYNYNSSNKNKVKLQKNLIDLEIISYFFLFISFFIVLNYINTMFSIMVVCITFFLIFCIASFLKFINTNYTNIYLRKIKNRLSSDSAKKSIILGIGNFFKILLFSLIVIFYFFFELTDGLYLIIAMMMMRRIGRCVVGTFQKQILIYNLKNTI